MQLCRSFKNLKINFNVHLYMCALIYFMFLFSEFPNSSIVQGHVSFDSCPISHDLGDSNAGIHSYHALSIDANGQPVDQLIPNGTYSLPYSPLMLDYTAASVPPPTAAYYAATAPMHYVLSSPHITGTQQTPAVSHEILPTQMQHLHQTQFILPTHEQQHLQAAQEPSSGHISEILDDKQVDCASMMNADQTSQVESAAMILLDSSARYTDSSVDQTEDDQLTIEHIHEEYQQHLNLEPNNALINNLHSQQWDQADHNTRRKQQVSLQVKLMKIMSKLY